MNYSRTLTPVCSLLATALLALAQTPASVPAPRPMALPMPAPVAPLPPIPRLDIDLGDLDVQISMAKEMTLSPELQDQIDAAKEIAGRMKLDMQERAFEMAAAKDMLRGGLAFAPQSIAPPRPPTPPRPPKEITFRGMIDDSFYARGQSALDNRIEAIVDHAAEGDF